MKFRRVIDRVPNRSFVKVVFLSVSVLSLLLLQGCSAPDTDDDATVVGDESTPLEKINLLVVGDENIGAIIKRQWSTRRDGELTVQNISVSEMVKYNCQLDSDVDVVIYPPYLLGDFVAHEQIAEIPASVWGDDELLNNRELLRHARSTLVSFSKNVWAVPLGSPNFVMLYRKDVLEQLDANPPTTWEGFHKLAAKLRAAQAIVDDAGNDLPTEIGIPLSGQWAANIFLARAAAYIRYRGKLSTVFDRNTMEPLIESEPFVKALREMKSDFSGSKLSQDPRQIYADMVAGRTAIAISWPAPLSAENPNVQSNDLIGIARLPGAKRWFDSGGNGWTERPQSESVHVELLGFEGFVASINRKSGRSLTSQEFLKWLPSKSISLATVAGSPRSGPFRASQLGAPTRWTGEEISTDAAVQYADIIGKINDQSVVLVFPRIPGRLAYLESLNSAVTDCLSGKLEPKAALKSAAEQWKKITEKYGSSAQRALLRRGEGI